MVHDNLLEGMSQGSTSIEWVDFVNINLLDFSVIAGDRTVLAKYQMKEAHDKSAIKPVEFPLGSMVLMCTLGLSSKFQDSWTGPYEILPWHTSDARLSLLLKMTW